MGFKTFIALLVCASALSAQEPAKYDYRLLATTKTSTMEKEMNQAAADGYAFSAVMGGESAFGGNEVIIIMAKDTTATAAARRKYRLLATRKTSTMQKEMQQAADEGFVYRGQTVFESAFGGREVGLIMERDLEADAPRTEYTLLATSKTSTMQKELKQAGEAGFQLLGMTLGETSFGGKEVVCILGRAAKK